MLKFCHSFSKFNVRNKKIDSIIIYNNDKTIKENLIQKNNSCSNLVKIKLTSINNNKLLRTK